MKVKKGDVVYMKSTSGCVGYGNPQCVSSVCEPLDEIGLYGHNQHYNIYDIREIVNEQPASKELTPVQGSAEDIWVKWRDMEDSELNYTSTDRVLNAMREYASSLQPKEVQGSSDAVEFKDWCDKNTYELETRNEVYFSTAQLYTLFLNNKNKAL